MCDLCMFGLWEQAQDKPVSRLLSQFSGLVITAISQCPSWTDLKCFKNNFIPMPVRSLLLKYDQIWEPPGKLIEIHILGPISGNSNLRCLWWDTVILFFNTTSRLFWTCYVRLSPPPLIRDLTHGRHKKCMLTWYSFLASKHHFFL